jgi:glycosyltransferase involved in cell wall biosynthesis
MGKNKKRKLKTDLSMPNVSICTPTFNRRPFFEGLLKCIQSQDYPHSKIEWIVLDDGTDKVEDIFQDEKTKSMLGDITLRYFYFEEKMDLGKKRNLMHQKCCFRGDEDIVVYMDDDDYYPSERVSHSVKRLTQDKNALCGGSSELFCWFNVLNKMYKFGPYGPNHATAGTFAFKRKLLKDTSYENSAVLAEEKHFLKNYTVPFVQFDPFKTILVVSHEQNTFDKKKLLNSKNKYVKESSVQVKQFIPDKEQKLFYESKIDEKLKDYAPGDVKNKPNVLKEISRREEERKIQIQNMQKDQDNKASGIYMTDNSLPNNPKHRELSMKEVKEYLGSKTNECVMMKKELQRLKQENELLTQKIKNANISTKPPQTTSPT